MLNFMLKGYVYSIYSTKGLREFIKKAYDLPNAKNNTKYLEIHTGIIEKLNTYEHFVKEKARPLCKRLEEDEKQRFYEQFCYMVRRRTGEKYVSDINDILELGEKSDDVVKSLCCAASKIRDPAIKKEYQELIKPIAELYKEQPPKNIAKKVYDEYLAKEEMKDLRQHSLKRDTVSRGATDVELGSTILKGNHNKKIQLPTKPRKLTDNSTLIVDKSGKFYYVKIDGKLLRYNENGEMILSLPQGSFGHRSIDYIRSIIEKVWGII